MLKLNLITQILIVGSAVSRGAYFAIFPFLAIYLQESLKFDLQTIGLILGFGPLLGSLVGFYGGYLADFFGRKRILISSLLFWGVTQVLYGQFKSVFALFVLSGLNGVFRAVAEPVIQAVVADNTSEGQRAKAFHYRYYAINVGAAIGPLIGSWFLLSYPRIGFFLAGLPLALFAMTLSRFLNEDKEKFESQSAPTFLTVLKTLANDKVLLCYVSASVFCAVAYSQIDSILPLIMKEQFKEKGMSYFGYVISANAFTIIALQLIINRLTQKIRTEKVVFYSSFLFAIGFLGFAFSGESLLGFLLSMFILSIGELSVFSNSMVLIDKLSPDSLRATYHSSANLYSIGICLGPPLGAMILENSNSDNVFYIGTLSLLFTTTFYFIGSRLKDSKIQTEKMPRQE